MNQDRMFIDAVHAMNIVQRAWPDVQIRQYYAANGQTTWLEAYTDAIGILGSGNTENRNVWIDCLKHPTVWPYMLADFEVWEVCE